MPSRERTAFLLRDQADYCAAMGSPLYARLLGRAAEDAEAGGPVHALLEPFDAPNLRADALALRLMAAVHRLVLTGAAPRLAAHYPIAWLRFESTPATRGYAVTLTTWPGGEERVVATAGAHGADVRGPLSPT